MVPANNIVARRRRVIKASVGLLLVAGASWLLGYLISSIPASWSPSCYTKVGQMVACPNMSLPSIPFVAPKIDVISIWTMSQWFASLTIHLAVSSLFRNESSLTILFLYLYQGIGYCLIVYFCFFVMSDLFNFQFSFLNTLSTHSLLVYILRSQYGFKLASCIIPNDSPLFMLPVLLLIGVGTNVLIVKFLQANNINVRL